MPLLISELYDQRKHSIALHVSQDPGHVEHDRIAGLESTQHSLEVREGSNRNTIDTIDNVAFQQHRLSAGIAQLRDQSVWIDVLEVKTLDACQVTVSEQLRCQFRQRDSEMQCIAAWIAAVLWSRAGWSNPFSRA